MKKLLWILPLALLVLAACSDKRSAGSASVTTNGTVAGVVRDSNGTVLKNATAVLIPNTADPADSGLKVLSDMTDAQGRFYFGNVPMGDYRLVVRSTDSSLAATYDPVTIDSSSDVKVDSLAVTTAAGLRILRADYSYALNDRFYLPGTDMEVVVTAKEISQGFVAFTCVPFGDYEQMIHVPAARKTELLPMFYEPFEVNSALQTLVPDYEQSASSPIGFATLENPSPVWGGASGDTIRISDSLALKNALNDTLSHVIVLDRFIRGNGSMYLMRSNKTLLGIGDSAGLDSLGISIRSDSNIVIRNINFRRGAIDAISIEDSSRHIWIDHNSFSKYGDGLVDIKRASDLITISWNKFRNHRSVSLIGHTDNNGAQDSLHLRVTFHHNSFDSIENTAPRVRYGMVHLFNNTYSNISGYAIASTQHAQVVAESNYFNHVDETTLIGHTSPLPGDLVETGNLYVVSGAPATAGAGFDPQSLYSYNPGPVAFLRNQLYHGAGAGKLKSLQ